MSLQILAPYGKGRAYQGSDPAANAEATITVPSTAKRWLLLSASITLVQGATQTPLGSLIVKDNNAVQLAQFPGASAATSASTTTQYNWFPGATLTAGAGATVNYAPIPAGLILAPGWVLTTSTSGIGANTNYGALAVWVVAL